jgi:subtilase family serine protease
MKVEFRWLDADGNLQRKSTRVSRACRQPGELANLRAGDPTASTGPEGTSVYVVPVRNDGKAAAQDVAVELFVDGAATNVGHVDSLVPGESRDVRFTGPPCKRGLRMVVDPSDSVKEQAESDNVTTASCPALAR